MIAAAAIYLSSSLGVILYTQFAFIISTSELQVNTFDDFKLWLMRSSHTRITTILPMLINRFRVFVLRGVQ